MEVIPLTRVVADSLKHANVGFGGADFNKVCAIGAHKGNYGLDTSHPHIVEDDVAAEWAERGVQIKVYEHIIEAMVAIDENDFKGGIGSLEVGGDAAGAILDK